MADTAKLIIIKEFEYRGASEEWSNVYHLSENPHTSWADAAEDLVALEQALLPDQVHYVKAYGYDVGPEVKGRHITAEHSLAGRNGSISASEEVKERVPGDAALTLGWKTAEFNERGRRIWLRKYFHGAFVADGGDPDFLWATQKTLAETFGTQMMVAGAIDGADFVGPRGAHPIERVCSPYITTRTLKRRGKRPPTPE